ncbi:5'-nucleotidase SurE [Dirofilaria immitis]
MTDVEVVEKSGSSSSFFFTFHCQNSLSFRSLQCLSCSHFSNKAFQICSTILRNLAPSRWIDDPDTSC